MKKANRKRENCDNNFTFSVRQKMSKNFTCSTFLQENKIINCFINLYFCH